MPLWSRGTWVLNGYNVVGKMIYLRVVLASIPCILGIVGGW